MANSNNYSLQAFTLFLLCFMIAAATAEGETQPFYGIKRLVLSGLNSETPGGGIMIAETQPFYEIKRLVPSGPNPETPGGGIMTAGTQPLYEINRLVPSGPNPETPGGEIMTVETQPLYEIKRLVPSGPNPETPGNGIMVARTQPHYETKRSIPSGPSPVGVISSIDGENQYWRRKGANRKLGGIKWELKRLVPSGLNRETPGGGSPTPL